MNTKYISSNVLKIPVISRVRRTSEIADIFNTRYLPRKVNFSFFFFFFVKEKQLNIFPSHFSFAWLSVFSGCIIGCKRRLHLEMIYYVFLVNRYKEICGLRKPLDLPSD